MTRIGPKCTHCNQQACLASDALLLCGTHWRDFQAECEALDKSLALHAQIEAAETVEDLKAILFTLVAELQL